MFENFLRVILALLLLGCPCICGQCQVACAAEMSQAGSQAEADTSTCQRPCCAKHRSAQQTKESSPLSSPDECPCESAGVCICDGAVVEEAFSLDRPTELCQLMELVMLSPALDVPAEVAPLTFSAKTPPGRVASGRDVRTACASFLL